MLAIGVMLTTCAVQAAPQTLYQRLGEDTGIRYLVQTAIGKIGADHRINKRFAHANIPRLTTQVTNFVVQATGGPHKYKGPSMAQAHKGMHITTAEFTAFMQDFAWAMNKVAVGKAEQKELTAKMTGLEPQIVEGPATPAKKATSKKTTSTSKKPATKPSPVKKTQ
ncbi:MAG: group I truncated hemoglobin [Candidatus Xenobia bacterium]